jgi:HTH-type transcriptional regulator / antitoxin HigA
MNNRTEYRDIMAFHPGYYIADTIEELGINQTEFASRMGTTGKTLSKLVNGQSNLTNDLAQKLAAMLGTSVDLWLNLQKAYDEKVIEIERLKSIDDQAEVMKAIDYSYFEKVAKLGRTRKITEKIVNLCKYFMIADLRILKEPDFLVNFRTGISTVQDKNLINARAWIQTALNCAKGIELGSFSAEKLKGFLPDIRRMTVQDPDEFLPRLKDIFSECGVAFVLLPHLKNSGINGAVKWYAQDHVILAMNDRRCYADTFWFSLFHEIKHVLQQKVKTVFISGDFCEISHIDNALEKEADVFAQDYLIPPLKYKALAPTRYISDAEIVAFAKEIVIHPGVVAGRLQHDGIIAQNRCSQLKDRYHIAL